MKSPIILLISMLLTSCNQLMLPSRTPQTLYQIDSTTAFIGGNARHFQQRHDYRLKHKLKDSTTIAKY